MIKSLTLAEKAILHDFIGILNYHEMMAILCKIYPSLNDDAREIKRVELFKIFCKLGDFTEVRKELETK